MKRLVLGSVALAVLLCGAVQADYIYMTVGAASNVSPLVTEAYGINSSGQIVGDVVSVSKFYGPQRSGFLETPGNPPQFQTYGGFGENATAFGINNVGQVVGTYVQGGFLVSGGTITTLNVPSSLGIVTVVRGINDPGQIVGAYYTGSNSQGFLLSGGNYTTLTVPGSARTVANGISASSQIVGEYTDASGKNHGFLLSGGNYTTLDLPGASSTIANGINGSGQIVGTFDDKYGFVLSAGAFTTLDFPGSVSTFAEGINDLGDVVGYYDDSSGNRFGFLAEPAPVPEPSTVLLLGIGVLGIIGWTSWKRSTHRAAAL